MAITLVVLLSSCTVTLSPKFDQGIIDNLTISSNEVFELLAQVSGGTTSETFNAREEKYNKVIGRFRSLVLHINARPMPNNKLVEKTIAKANARLAERGVGTITAATTAPSASALTQIIANLEAMKGDDKTTGLTTTEITAFKGFIELFLDQAVTYEKFLNK